VKHGDRAMRIGGIAVEAGTTIDFVVECRANELYDSFSWAPVIELATPAGERLSFDASRDFRGPRGPADAPLSRLERYAQVLLETNELAFVD
jgi:hypothetical protein